MFSREALIPAMRPVCGWVEWRVKLEWTEVVRAEGRMKRLSSAVVMWERPRVAGSRNDSWSRSFLLHQNSSNRKDMGGQRLLCLTRLHVICCWTKEQSTLTGPQSLPLFPSHPDEPMKVEARSMRSTWRDLLVGSARMTSAP
jgi:hypothetical protein